MTTISQQFLAFVAFFAFVAAPAFAQTGPVPVRVMIGPGVPAQCKFGPGVVLPAAKCQCHTGQAPIVIGTADALDADAQIALDWRRAQAAAPADWDHRAWARPVLTTVMAHGAIWCAPMDVFRGREVDGFRLDDDAGGSGARSRRRAPPRPTGEREGYWHQPSCADSADNDGDGLVDVDDPDCWGPERRGIKNFLDVEVCLDHKDNDGDGKFDERDEGCQPEALCSDGLDNDGDGLVDVNDPDCWKSREGPVGDPSCADGKDNDRDGLVDAADEGCQSPSAERRASRPPSRIGVHALVGLTAGFAGALNRGMAPLRTVDGREDPTFGGFFGCPELGVGVTTPLLSAHLLGCLGPSESSAEGGGGYVGGGRFAVMFRLHEYVELGLTLNVLADVSTRAGVRTVTAGGGGILAVPATDWLILWLAGGPAYGWDDRAAKPNFISGFGVAGATFVLPPRR